MTILEILDSQAKRSAAKIKQLDKEKNHEKIRKKQAEISKLQKTLNQG